MCFGCWCHGHDHIAEKDSRQSRDSRKVCFAAYFSYCFWEALGRTAATSTMIKQRRCIIWMMFFLLLCVSSCAGFIYIHTSAFLVCALSLILQSRRRLFGVVEKQYFPNIHVIESRVSQRRKNCKIHYHRTFTLMRNPWFSPWSAQRDQAHIAARNKTSYLLRLDRRRERERVIIVFHSFCIFVHGKDHQQKNMVD